MKLLFKGCCLCLDYMCVQGQIWQALGKGIFRELVNGREDTQKYELKIEKKSRKIILLCLGFLWFSSSLGPTCSSCWRQNNELDRPLIWISVIFHVFFIYPQLHLTNQIFICCLIALFLAQSVYENTAFHIWIGIEPLIKASHMYSCSIWYLGMFGWVYLGFFGSCQ